MATRIRSSARMARFGRVATVIKDACENMVYIYVGEGAVVDEQPYLLGVLVARCISWRWTGLLYAAMRIMALRCNNNLGPLHEFLVDSEDDVERNTTNFLHDMARIWEGAGTCCDELVADSTWTRRKVPTNKMTRQARVLAAQLEVLKTKYLDEVTEFLESNRR